MVEAARPGCRINLAQVLANLARPAKVNRMPAHLPEQELHDPFHILVIGLKIRVPLWIKKRLKARKPAAVPLQANHRPRSHLLGLAPEVAVRQNSRAKTFVQRRQYPRLDQFHRH